MLLNEETILWEYESHDIKLDEGYSRKIKGTHHRIKGFVQPELIFCINIVKKTIKEFAKILLFPPFTIAFLFYPKKKLILAFNEIFHRVFTPYKLNIVFQREEEHQRFLCRPAYYFGETIRRNIAPYVDNDTVTEFAFNLAYLLECDDVYRYRFQDVCGVIDVYGNPRKELKKAWRVFKERSQDDVPKKLKGLYYILSLLLLFKKVDLYPLQFCRLDEDDFFWTYFNSRAYHYGGLRREERILDSVPQFTKKMV